MKTTFSRTFSTAATILLLALLLLGMSFQMLVKDYLTENAFSTLQNDADVISNLAAAYSIDGSLSSRDFRLNLDVATQISGSDAIICNADGKIVICSDSPFGCEHQMLVIEEKYLDEAFRTRNGHR